MTEPQRARRGSIVAIAEQRQNLASLDVSHPASTPAPISRPHWLVVLFPSTLLSPIQTPELKRRNNANQKSSILDRLPAYSATLFEAKTQKRLTFEAIAEYLGRSEVAVAAIFYGQARASPEDVDKLVRLLGLSAESNVAAQMMGFPDRGRAGPMPPVEPLIYRLYEIVQNYGYAFKAVINEKFGDGIMSAICFNSKVEKEVVRSQSHFLRCLFFFFSFFFPVSF
ncbi:hypothetical protein VTG60DRAFT_5540 [Thermothelomyces hinnuleus]